MKDILMRAIAVLVTIGCILTINTGNAVAVDNCDWVAEGEANNYVLTQEGYDAAIQCMRNARANAGIEGNPEWSVRILEGAQEKNVIKFKPKSNYEVTKINETALNNYNYEGTFETVFAEWLKATVKSTDNKKNKKYQSLIAIFAEAARSEVVRERVANAITAGTGFKPGDLLWLYQNYSATCKRIGYENLQQCPVLQGENYVTYAEGVFGAGSQKVQDLQHLLAAN
ncbi:MAG: hypothetical protein F6J93_34780 [Oscillatoria sp. SIO1A7]|nr:hypothetical protein [Oscillatoria sp. SIO1A7]